MADGNDSDSRKSQDERRRSRTYGEGKSNEENMGAESAHRDNEHRRGSESEFQGWNEQSRFRDISMSQAPGPSPPPRGWNQHRGNEQGHRANWGLGLRQTQRNQRKRKRGKERPARSDEQIDRMVANIVARTKKVPHRVNLSGCPVIPGGWPKPDPLYLRRIREADACFLCQWVDSEGLPLCDGRHSNATHKPTVLPVGIGHTGPTGKATTAMSEENQGRRRDLPKALSFRATSSDPPQDTVVDAKMKALKDAKASLEKQAATQKEEQLVMVRSVLNPVWIDTSCVGGLIPASSRGTGEHKSH